MWLIFTLPSTEDRILARCCLENEAKAAACGSRCIVLLTLVGEPSCVVLLLRVLAGCTTRESRCLSAWAVLSFFPSFLAVLLDVRLSLFVEKRAAYTDICLANTGVSK